VPKLLTNDGMCGVLLLNAPSDQLLCLAVGNGHRSFVALELGAQARLEVT
jgi:hypothetical protein